MRLSLAYYMEMVGKYKEEITAMEVGVYKGENAVEILEEPRIKLYLVDDYSSGSQWFSDNKGEKISTPEEIEILVNEVEKLFQKYDKACLIRKTSLEASKDFPNNFFDYIYIDGSHDYENVLQDMTVWYPKVKEGGMLAGHDVHLPDVTKAIVEFATVNNLPVFNVIIGKEKKKGEDIPPRTDRPFKYMFLFTKTPTECIDLDLNEVVDWWIFKVPSDSPNVGLHITTCNSARKLYPDNNLI